MKFLIRTEPQDLTETQTSPERQTEIHRETDRDCERCCTADAAGQRQQHAAPLITPREREREREIEMEDEEQYRTQRRRKDLKSEQANSQTSTHRGVER